MRVNVHVLYLLYCTLYQRTAFLRAKIKGMKTAAHFFVWLFKIMPTFFCLKSWKAKKTREGFPRSRLAVPVFREGQVSYLQVSNSRSGSCDVLIVSIYNLHILLVSSSTLSFFLASERERFVPRFLHNARRMEGTDIQGPPSA